MVNSPSSSSLSPASSSSSSSSPPSSSNHTAPRRGVSKSVLDFCKNKKTSNGVHRRDSRIVRSRRGDDNLSPQNTCPGCDHQVSDVEDEGEVDDFAVSPSNGLTSAATSTLVPHITVSAFDSPAAAPDMGFPFSTSNLSVPAAAYDLGISAELPAFATPAATLNFSQLAAAPAYVPPAAAPGSDQLATMPDFDLLAAAPGLAQLTAAYNLGVLAAAPAYVPPAAAPDFSPLAATPDFDLLAAAPGLAQLDAAYNLGVLDAASAYVTPAAAPDFVPPAVAPAFAPLAAAPGLAQLAAGYNSSTLLATATLDSGGASGISNGLASAVAEAFDLYCAIVALSTEIARPSNIIGDDLVNRISTVFRIINPTAGAVFDNFANSAGGIINSLVNARTASYNGST